MNVWFWLGGIALFAFFAVMAVREGRRIDSRCCWWCGERLGKHHANGCRTTQRNDERYGGRH